MARYGFNIGLDGHRIQPMTEKEAQEIADGLVEVYAQARERMLEAVSKRLARGVGKFGWAERKTGEVLEAHHQLESNLQRVQRERENLISNSIDRAYMTGSQQFHADMVHALGTLGVEHVSPNAAKAAYILADLNNSLNAAERRILRQFDDKYADVIGAVSSKMATGIYNTRQALGEALTAFADQGITGFTDRSGRHWTLENYAEMALLTAIERSTISGYVDTMESYGYDLAVIDGHAGSCPICEAWEGVIISISGDNGDYPSLDEAEGAGCFHPRCLHGIHTYYPGITHEPKGGFRNEPREIESQSPQYTARSKQRYCERMIRKYKDRAIVAQTPLQKKQAMNKVHEWEDALDELIGKQPSDNYMYRHRNREAATAGNELLHKQPTHQRVSAEGRKVIPEALYNKLIEPVIRSGGIVERGTEFAEKHLRDQGAYASHLAGALFFRKDATISDVLEEVFHYHQERGTNYSQYGAEEQMLRMEIDAKKYLLSVAERYKIPSEETDLTRQELLAYERRLADWQASH